MTIKDHEGREFDSVKALCKHYNLARGRFDKAIKSGQSIEDAIMLSKVIDTTCTDHLGNKYCALGVMCKHYGVLVPTYSSRIKRGYSVEEALTAKNGNHIECTDHKGNKFETKKEMAAHWGINYALYMHREATGWDIERILTTEVKSSFCKDHLGFCYDTLKAMCDDYDISSNVYKQRIEDGWSIERALTTPTKKYKVRECHTGKIKDHLGIEYKTLGALCEAYNITYHTYYCRLEAGWDLEDVLTKSVADNRKRDCVDHLGNKFNSTRAMCMYYGIHQSTYCARVKAGLNLEDILTKNITRRAGKRKCVDHLGCEFASVSDLCAYYGINVSTYLSRISLGWDLERALTEIVVKVGGKW